MGEAKEKYRVILVDDEPIILRSLKAAIPWEELNLEIAGEAKNGEGALALVDKASPHIIVSDIRMPGIDGITLMKEVMSDHPHLLFIFISGYGEFEYAREALREGAFDYLLKPIDHDELTGTIERAVRTLQKRLENDRLLHSVQALSLLARERMLTEFIEGSRSPLQHMQWLENSELDQGYYMGVLQLDQYLKLNSVWTMDEKRLWMFAIRNILEEWSLRSGGLTVFPFRSGEWVLLFPSRMKEQQEELGRDVVQLIKRNIKLSCSIGFSRSTMGIDKLSTAYETAVKALYQRFYSGQEVVFFSSNNKVESTEEAIYPHLLEAKMLDCIRTLNRERLLELVEETKIYIEQHEFSKEIAERMLVELTVVLYRQFEHMNVLLEWSLESLLQNLHDCGTLSDMIAVLQANFGQWMLENKIKQPKENIHAVIEKAQAYIMNHYQKDLSIEEVAERADLSISHFCTLFKQVSGYTFLEYLTQCRMEKAKTILLNTNVKVYQVAPLVGYQDPRYFTQVFKKLTGKTPSEYRE